MCKSLFGGGSNRAARLQIIEQQRQQAEINAKQSVAEAARLKVQKEALALQKKNDAFQREQAKKNDARQAKIDEIAARPDPVSVAPPPPPPAMVSNGQTADSDSGFNAAEDEDNVDSRRKGRKSLRIDLAGPQTAGATGLNVPKG